jgi:hypothetical protein
MAARATNDSDLFKPLKLSGEAIERDRQVKDRNHAVKPSEAEWLARAEAQDADISASETEFFITLRERMKVSK